MIFTKLKRVIKAGFVNFWRNGWVSLAAILVVTITLVVMGSLIFFKKTMDSALTHVQDKVDIIVYFKTDATEDNILTLKKTIDKLDEVKNTEYISSDQALINFKERNKNNETLIQSLEELDRNPLGAMLNIKAKDISKFGSVAKFLEDKNNPLDNFIIDKINYNKNKKIIDRLSEILNTSKKIGLIISLILVAVSSLVTFNTIRLAIYSSREEIEVMKLVGASNRFVSGPFVVEGMMYGLFSAFAAMLVFYPLTKWLDPKLSVLFTGISLFGYYINNFGQILATLFGVGIFLCAMSSLIAIRRYLKI